MPTDTLAGAREALACLLDPARCARGKMQPSCSAANDGAVCSACADAHRVRSALAHIATLEADLQAARACMCSPMATALTERDALAARVREVEGERDALALLLEAARRDRDHARADLEVQAERVADLLDEAERLRARETALESVCRKWLDDTQYMGASYGSYEPDPLVADLVLEAERRGVFGALMCATSAAWARRVGGGAFAVGPCLATVARLRRITREALTPGAPNAE